MRTLISKEIQQKLAALPPQSMTSLASILRVFEEKSKMEILERTAEPAVLQLGKDMHVVHLKGTYVYFFFGTDDQGEYLMLLDVTAVSLRSDAGSFFAVKDPRSNASLNPAYNTSINPRYNTSLNPKYNTSINPQYNSSINPRYNSSINPQYNSSINPRYNSSINPRYNSTINPRYNSSINPRFNSAFGGPFVYTIDLQQEAYIVRANDQVRVIFDLQGQFSGFAVVHDSGVHLVFNRENEWIAFLVPSGQDPLLRFDTNGKWTGLVV